MAQRRGAAGAGVVLLGAGGVAVFVSDNGPGTLAMLVLGGVFLVLGITGVLPKRLTLGNNSVEYGEFAGDVVESVLDEGEPQVREAVARHVIELAERRDVLGALRIDTPEGRRLLNSARRALLAEETLDAVRRNLPSGCVEFNDAEGLIKRDVVFGRPGAPVGKRVRVRAMYATIREPWLQNYVKTSTSLPFGAHVYLGPGSDLPMRAWDDPPLFAAGWAGEFDDAKLQSVLTAALDAAERSAARGKPSGPRGGRQQRGRRDVSE